MKWQIWLFHPMAESFGMMTYQVPLPTWQTLIPQVALFFAFEDMFHYFGMFSICLTSFAMLIVFLPHSPPSATHRCPVQAHSQNPP